MSLFRGLFGNPQDDLIYGSDMQMQPMGNMMDPFDMLSPFGGFGGFGARQSLMPFGFPDMNMIMNNFKHQMNGAMAGGNNCHSYSSSTMMTMSSGPNGQPQIYQESSSTRTGPGGIKEVKKSVCDSRSGTKRLAIGRHIGERGHVKERVQNMRSGEREDTEDYINIEEEEAEHFDREWRQKAGRHGRISEHSALSYHGRDDDRPLAITAGPSSRSRTRPSSSSHLSSASRYGPTSSRPHTYSSPETHDGPIIEEVDDDDEVVADNPRKRRRERTYPEITEVTEADAQLPRKLKQRSRKYVQSNPPH